jgi:hypothetical protein
MYSTKEAASALGISPGSTTRRMEAIRDRTGRLVAAAAPVLSPSGRPQCLRRSIRELLASWAKLYTYNPAAADAMLEEICDETVG